VVLQVLWTLVSDLSLAAECLQLIDGMYACVCCLRIVCMQAWMRVLPAYGMYAGMDTCVACVSRLAYV
jgi:hypothetical protein